MATKKLAKELGLIRRSSRPINVQINEHAGVRSRQIFSHLIVIDFESTCWRERKNYAQEIIEFPAVLLNTSNGQIESEFHTYVQPQEHPVLSEFCTELTGIRQTQVEAGVPLQICMSLFTRWLQTLQQEKNIEFIKDNALVSTPNTCTFVTWSDWDLGVCLLYECKRKQILRPEFLNRWIDLRATYKLFYNRKPKGLNGALQDLGIVFSGREHSGLDDARNTAHLAWRMITDGCLLKITRNLERAPLKTKPFLHGPQKCLDVGNGNEKTESDPKFTKSAWKQSGFEEKENESICESNRNIVVCQNLVMPKTVLSGLTTAAQEGRKPKQETLELHPVARSHLSVTLPSRVNNSLVLVSTTVDCVADKPQLGMVAEHPTLASEWEEHQLLTEVEESCSYDDVILEDTSDTVTCVGTFGVPLHDINSRDLNADFSPGDSKHSNKIIFKSSNTTVYSVEKLTSCFPSSSTFKLPLSSCKSRTVKSISYPNTALPSNRKAAYGPVALTEPPEFIMMTPKRSFTYKDESRLPSRSSLCTSLASSSFADRTSLPAIHTVLKDTGRMTSPLCDCGRRAKRLTVGNGGPNHGRVFYSCPIGRNGSGIKRRCGFFKWESTLLKASSASSSLCFATSASLSSSKRNSTGGSPQLKRFARSCLRH